MPLRFGEFAVDLDRRELRDRSGPVHLTPKAFELLQVLLEARPKVISRATLYDRLWPDTFVQPANLHNLIRELRIALGDTKRQVIRTNYGFGFCFAADVFVDHLPQAARQILIVGGQPHDLREGENAIGRDRTSTVRIESQSISRLHARIIIDADRATIEDLGSKNGTFLRGQRLHAAAALSDGDTLLFGSITAIFRVLTAPESTETLG